MAHSKDLFECSICTQLLNDPVTTTCGHSFCVKCIYTHWDTKRNRRRSAQCDICTERKRKACMFCQVCLASYCQTHLEPHFIVPPLKKHRLITASINIKESICCRHDKLQEIYCLTDQQFVCRMCALDEHKDHDIHKGQIPPAVFRKVRVHLNYEEGSLAFYSVSCIESLTLLHQIQTTFTEPLYPRFSVDLGATLRISNIRDSAQFPMLMY